MAIGDFQIEAKEGRARVGTLETKHGTFETPAFMPVGTQATVKGVSPDRLVDMGAQIVLTNTYHLFIRPGDELIRDLGGIHSFMGWDGPILSDSGGYQVFSLSKLRKISEDGVEFRSHIDGAKLNFTPASVIGIQENLGVDIMMVLDECLPADADYAAAANSWQLTLDWARRSQDARTKDDALAFGIVQGGMFEDLRKAACADLTKLKFNGYAIGGLSVGESTELMRGMTDICCAELPEEQVRYLMGVGTPVDLVESVNFGVDMFDCVIPTRSARFGRIYIDGGFINLKNERFKRDPRPLQPGCSCYTCQNFSRAYLSHLTRAQEMLGGSLCSIHNLSYYQELMAKMRAHLRAGTFSDFRNDFLAEQAAGVVEEAVSGI